MAASLEEYAKGIEKKLSHVKIPRDRISVLSAIAMNSERERGEISAVDRRANT